MEAGRASGSHNSSKPARLIACVRCRRRKKKCDHAQPICGECKRSAAECRSLATLKTEKYVKVPTIYLEKLESRLGELEERMHDHNSEPAAQSLSAPEFLGPDANAFLAAQSLPVFGSSSTDITFGGVFDDEPGGSVPFWTDISSSASLVPTIGSTSYSHTPTALPLKPEQRWRSFDFAIGIESLFQCNDGFAGGVVAGPDFAWLPEFYANVYFSNVQTQWPFLHEATWRQWFKTWRPDGPARDRWQGFFIEVVCAIGALLCGAIEDDSLHHSRSQSYYGSAMRKYRPDTMRLTSAVLRTHSGLLLIMYTLQRSSQEDISNALNMALVECLRIPSATRSSYTYNGTDATGMEDDREAVQTRTLMTCFIVNEVINTNLDRSSSANSQVLDDQIYEQCLLVSKFQGEETYAAFEHLFRLRRIQARIRRYIAASNPQSPPDVFASRWTQDIQNELASWGEEIPVFANQGSLASFLKPRWMESLPRLILSTLLHGLETSFSSRDLHILLGAASEACRTFAVFLVERKLMAFTWLSLVYQFRAGIALLYCFWATPSSLRSDIHDSPETHKAVTSCSWTLDQFAKKWNETSVYRDAFDLLAQEVPRHGSAGDELWTFPAARMAELQNLLDH